MLRNVITSLEHSEVELKKDLDIFVALGPKNSECRWYSTKAVISRAFSTVFSTNINIRLYNAQTTIQFSLKSLDQNFFLIIGWWRRINDLQLLVLTSHINLIIHHPFYSSRILFKGKAWQSSIYSWLLNSLPKTKLHFILDELSNGILGLLHTHATCLSWITILSMLATLLIPLFTLVDETLKKFSSTSDELEDAFILTLCLLLSLYLIHLH